MAFLSEELYQRLILIHESTLDKNSDTLAKAV